MCSSDLPLHRAAEGGHVEAAEFLLAHGADWRMRDGEDLMPVDWAAFRQYKELIRLFTRRGAELDIFSAVAAGDKERVATLLKANPNLINSRRGRFGTPLQVAKDRRLTAMVEFLVQHGAQN